VVGRVTPCAPPLVSLTARAELRVLPAAYGGDILLLDSSNHEFIPRVARHNGDTKGIEDISPGLPESARATLGSGFIQRITFARSAASEASISA
jgi:hypothetical protein